MSATTRAALGPLLVALAAAMWGLNGIIARYALSESGSVGLDGMTLGFWRLALAAPAVGLVMLLSSRERWWVIDRRMLVPFAAIGVCMATYQIGYYGAVARIGVSLSVLIAICGAPPVVAVLSYILLHERPGMVVIAGLCLASLGVAILVGAGSGGSLAGLDPQQAAVGLAFATLATLAYALFTIAGRAYAGRVHPAACVVYGFGFGAILLLPFASANGTGLLPDASLWPAIVALALVPTALAYVVYFRGMRTTPATLASVLTLLEPLTSVILAVVFLGEWLPPSGWFAAALLIAGIGIASLRSTATR